jgi:hypothetical protein
LRRQLNVVVSAPFEVHVDTIEVVDRHHDLIGNVFRIGRLLVVEEARRRIAGGRGLVALYLDVLENIRETESGVQRNGDGDVAAVGATYAV